MSQVVNKVCSLLLIEDNPADADLIEAYLSQLQSHEIETQHAKRFETGLEIARREQPDVALVDLTLPDSRASRTVERIAKIPDDVAVVVLTGRPTRQLELTALKQGAEEFLDKDMVNVELLKRCLDHAFERRRIRRKLQDQKQRLARYKTIVENTTDAVVIKDAEGRYRLVNESFLHLAGRSESEVIGETAVDVFGKESGQNIRQRESQVLEGGIAETYEETVSVGDSERTFLTTSIPLVEEDESPGLIEISRDITERKRMRENLEHLALYDQLTDLPNRALFYDRLEQAVERAQRRDVPFSVAFVDLDDFKAVNDSFGHAAGDELMRKAASRLQEALRSEDTVARVGGDEYIVLIEAVESREVLDTVGRRLQERFEPPFQLAEGEVHLSVSIGFAFPCPASFGGSSSELGMERLTRTADRAMYEAKRVTGTSWRIFNPSRAGQWSNRIQRRNRIRDGIVRGEFLPYYQPIYRLADRELVAFEVLSRWRQPESGMVPPADFIPVAEETELICELGREIAARACEEFGGRPDLLEPDEPFGLYLNLSPRQIEQPEAVERLSEIFDRELPDGLKVCFEVTETELLEHHSHVVDLRDRGFEVLVDDFGTGYSSLSRLKDMPVDGLKLDMEFVHGIGEGTADEAIARTVVQLGATLDIPVVAEGIETEEQLDFLVDAGCAEGQGFWFARPQPFEELVELLQTDKSDS